MNFSTALPLIQKSQRVLVVTHKNPDGDGIGSVLGLTLGLEQLGKEVCPFVDDPISETYQALPGHEKVKPSLPSSPQAFDLAISLDAADFTRLPEAAKDFLLKRNYPLLNFDHHPGNKEFGEVNVVESAAASTTSLVFRLLKALRVEITKPIAELLYVGHLVDTGRFSFQNTRAETLAEASELVAAGADPYRLNSLLYFHHPITHLRLLGRALDNLRLDREARIAWSRITRLDLDAANADAADFEGIPEFLLTTAEADIAILFGENHADDRIRISFRSRDAIDISRVAVSLGGGGHKNASGAQLRGTLDSVVGLVLDTTRRMRSEIS